MKETYLKQLLTDDNFHLWNKITDKDSVNIILWDKSYSQLFSNNLISEFRLSSLDVNAFNHELCHLYINQVCGGLYIPLKIRMPADLSDYIPNECIQFIGNFIEHKLFYQLYLQIGGDEQKFISDFNLKKGNNFHLRISRLSLKNLDPYLGNLFAIICDCNQKYSYSDELKKYRNISPIVFEACNNLLEEILQIGITEQLDDFGFDKDGNFNKTFSNACENFWEILMKEFFKTKSIWKINF